MATTFAGLAFGIHTTDGFVPLPEREVVYQTDHVPHGDVNVNQYGGLGPLKFRATLILAIAARASWEAKRGQTGTLIIDDVNYGTVRLVAFTNPRKTIRPAPVTQYLFVDVEMTS